MTMNVLGYAAPSAKAALAPYQFERRDMRNDDVGIEILYCGICHSDLHEVNNDWDRNSIYPMVPGGPIDTHFVNRVLNDQQTDQFIQNVVKATPLGRMGSPDEVAKAVSFLASDGSSYITGIELFVDGGMAQI